MFAWIISEREAGLTPLQILRRRLPTAPTGYLRQLLRSGKIRDAAGVLAENAVLQTGDSLFLPASRKLEELLAQLPAEPVILREAAHWLAAYKPAGLAVHRGLGHESANLRDQLQQWLKTRGEPYSVAPVHRLDLETSGPVLFGKGRRATSVLGRLFMTGTVEKIYLGLVSGDPGEQGMLLSPVPAKGKVKESATAFRRLGRVGGFSLLELRLGSGRTHQIRRQLADAGHPLAGDLRYGGPCLTGLSRSFLHCRRLAFTDPFAGTDIGLDSPLPPELKQVLHGLDPVAEETFDG